MRGALKLERLYDLPEVRKRNNQVRKAQKMNRVTDKHLSAKVDTINEIMHTPKTPWQKRKKGETRNVANVGNYHLSYAYGGVSLEQMVNEGGGVRLVCTSGHISKRELAGLMDAYISGIRDSKTL
jgi:hypothetical protein